jgi:hypothetical protein
MGYMIIGIHGLSNKPEASLLAKWWQDSILEGLMKNERFRPGALNFTSVYWADVLYAQPDQHPDAYIEAQSGALKSYEDGWKDVVKKHLFDRVGDIVDSLKKQMGVDIVADKVLERKLKDLSQYYENENVRVELRKRLRNVILANSNRKIMILSHSMGTIIAYDVLRELATSQPDCRVDHFITLGSPLGLPHVRYKISLEKERLCTPENVKQWSNFADKRDPVAIDAHLAGDYCANDEDVEVKDDLVLNDWKGIHHKSYGYLRAPEVSKTIKEFIA